MRGVAFGDGRRPAGKSLRDAQEMAGLPPGRWWGPGLAELGLTAGAEVSERQLELVFGQGRHPDADRIERGLLDDGADPATARRETVLGQRIEEIEARKQIPLLALDLTFRPQASLIVLWALGDNKTRRVIELAIATVLRWLETRSHRPGAPRTAGAPRRALVVAVLRDFDNRDGFPPPARPLPGPEPRAAPGRGRRAGVGRQRAVAIHAHQQAAMPEEYLEDRTTDPATWLRTPENLERRASQASHQVTGSSWRPFTMLSVFQRSASSGTASSRPGRCSSSVSRATCSSTRAKWAPMQK
ncbi:relaxase domain-containing protein [Streptomyces sp. MBT70]|nr:relaxase domain-containing protein [Streptomyces sp. MBT70]